MSQRRNNLDKERFLEGNRQKWCAVYTAIGIGVLLCTGFGLIPDPSPFLGFFTGIGVTFILGASATDVMKTYTIKSQTENKNVNVDVKISKDEEVINHFEEKYFDDPSYRPIQPEEFEEETWR